LEYIPTEGIGSLVSNVEFWRSIGRWRGCDVRSSFSEGRWLHPRSRCCRCKARTYPAGSSSRVACGFHSRDERRVADRAGVDHRIARRPARCRVQADELIRSAGGFPSRLLLRTLFVRCLPAPSRKRTGLEMDLNVNDCREITDFIDRAPVAVRGRSKPVGIRLGEPGRNVKWPRRHLLTAANFTAQFVQIIQDRGIGGGFDSGFISDWRMEWGTSLLAAANNEWRPCRRPLDFYVCGRESAASSAVSAQRHSW